MLGTNYTHPPLFVTFSLPRRPALPSPNLVATGSRRRGRPKLDHEVDNVRFSRAIILLDCTRVQRNLTLISFTHSPIRSLSWSPFAGFSAGLSPAQSLETPFFSWGGPPGAFALYKVVGAHLLGCIILYLGDGGIGMPAPAQDARFYQAAVFYISNTTDTSCLTFVAA